MNETRSKSLWRCSAILGSIAVLAGCAAAKPQPPQADPGGIAGVVLDTAGQHVANAYVLIVAGPMARGATLTDTDGSFSFPVRAGRYDLVVEKEGYEAVSRMSLQVTAGTDLMVNVKLHPVERVNGKPLNPGPAITPPIIISGPHPAYTLEALAHGVHGTLILKCVITVEGFVRSCRPVKKLEYVQGNAIAAIEARRYRPAMRDGKPVEVDYTIKLKYELP